MRELVLYTGCFAEPDENAAGKRVLGIALALEEAGYNVLLLGKAQRKGTKTIQYSEHVLFEALPEYGRVKYNGYFKHVVSVIEKQQKKPACVIRYSSPGLALFDNKLNRYCKSHGIPVVADVVDWLGASGPTLLYKAVKGVDTYLEKAVFNKKGSGVIAISTYLGNYYKKYNDNVIIIPPLVSKYTENTRINNKTVIVYAGIPFRLGVEVKNPSRVKDRLDLAVKVFLDICEEGTDSFIFNVYGVTKEEFLVAYPNFKDQLHEFNEAVCFHGKKPMEMIQRELNNADFSILLREENRGTMAGFSTKVVESLSCGTPVITTNTSDLSTYIIDGKNGFYVDIHNWNALKEKIRGITSLSSDEIIKLKAECLNNKVFLFSCYSMELKNFIKRLNE